MNKTILALLFTVALTGAAQGCGFNASAELSSTAEANRIAPTMAVQRNHNHHRIVAAASGTLDGLGYTRVTALTELAATNWKDTFKTMLDPRTVAMSCLARAVYFEARSESLLGQLAVATVILNRVKASNYPSSICGVVYKGASRLNACQFSFACDGKSDLPEDARAWKTALAVTALALAEDTEMKEGMQILATATHYHTDYVDPSWSRSLNRLTKIGHHIFYSQG